jgi:hypothetical protein
MSNNAKAAPKDITERINSLQDVFRLLKTTKKATIPFPKPIDKNQESLNAAALIQAIVKAYNQGFEFNWDNVGQPKWGIHMYRKNGGWVLFVVCDYFYGACLGAGHYFAERRLAEDAYKKFGHIWQQYMPE